MSEVVFFLSGLSAKLFDQAVHALNFLSPFWSLAVISIISGIILLLIYGKLSNQERLKQVKRQIYGSLLESIIFRHDVGLSLKSQAKMFGYGLYYLLLAVPPILILSVPCIFLLAQINLYYGARPLHVGERVIVRAKVNDAKALYQVALSPSAGLISTPPVRVEESKEIVWRLEAKEPSPQAVALQIGERAVQTTVVVGDGVLPLISQSFSTWWWQLLYPSDVLRQATDVISELTITYPSRYYKVWGEWSWISVFLLISILSGLVASRIFKVEI